MTKHNILITGAAGFIGAYLMRRLAADGHQVTGIDNFNPYYDPAYKRRRVAALCPQVPLHNLDITRDQELDALLRDHQFDVVVNLAAQAGVRYSIDHPRTYVENNVIGFLNVLECCRRHGVKHLVYASSSSVYGLNEQVPYRETDRTARPASLYAATKISDEAMAHAYSHLYGFSVTGLRFFTVYGPWGRPDMAPMKFMRAIMAGKPINVFNHGNMQRDFTYIDDIVQALAAVVEQGPKQPCGIYNVGHSSPMQLMDFIHAIEQVTGHQAQCHFMPMQQGDVLCTYSDTTRLSSDYGVTPATSVTQGLTALHQWLETQV